MGQLHAHNACHQRTGVWTFVKCVVDIGGRWCCQRHRPTRRAACRAGGATRGPERRCCWYDASCWLLRARSCMYHATSLVGDMRESLIFVMPVLCFPPCVQMISRPRRIRTPNRQRKRPWSRPGRQLAQSMVRACAGSCLCLERAHMYDLNAIDQSRRADRYKLI